MMLRTFVWLPQYLSKILNNKIIKVFIVKCKCYCLIPLYSRKVFRNLLLHIYAKVSLYILMFSSCYLNKKNYIFFG